MQHLMREHQINERDIPIVEQNLDRADVTTSGEFSHLRFFNF